MSVACCAGDLVAKAQHLRLVGDVGDMRGDAHALRQPLGLAQPPRLGHGLRRRRRTSRRCSPRRQLRASSRPMPEPPPVTTASLPANVFVSLLRALHRRRPASIALAAPCRRMSGMSFPRCGTSSPSRRYARAMRQPRPPPSGVWPRSRLFAIAVPGSPPNGNANMTKEPQPSPSPSIPGWGEIRDGVRHVCEQYPNAYWVKLDHESAYPTEFVNALTEAGYLGALIPEEYGGAGLPMSAGCAILETIHESGCNAAACHAQMYTMGTVLRHGNAAQKQKYLPGIASGELRLQAFGVTEPTTGSDTTQLKTRADKKGNDRYVVNGQKVWTSRVLQSDLMLLLARTTPPDKVQEALRRALRVPGRSARGQGQGRRDQEDRRHDQPQHLRGVLRQPRGARREPDRRGGPGLQVHRRQHERRAHPDRLGMPGRRQVLHPPRRRLRQGARRVRPADRPEPGRRLPDRARARRD